MRSRLVTLPQGNETVVIPVDAETPLVLNFDPHTVSIQQVDNDLVFISPDLGRVVIEDFYATPNVPMPIFLLGDTEIPGDDIIPPPSSPASPAAGPEQAAQLNDGARFREDSVDTILHGVDALDGLPVSPPPVVSLSFTLPLLTQAVPIESQGADSLVITGVSLPQEPQEPQPPQLPQPSQRVPTVQSFTQTTQEDSADTLNGNVLQGADSGTSPATLAWGAARYGTLEAHADGTYTYTLNNALTAVQQLGVGDNLHDVITYTYTNTKGESAVGHLTVTIHGTNDAPTVSAAVASVIEDTVITATGVLPTPQDVDAHDTPVFIPQTNTQGTYGTLTLTADGSYTYTLNTNLPAVQQLGVGESTTETFTYTVQDAHGGTAQNTITVTIHGTNDAPTVSAAVASVIEDTAITTTGVLPTPHDVDAHDTPAFIPQANTQGTYGTLTLTADGSYTYTLNTNLPAVQQLGVGESTTETFTYTVSDPHGATAQNTITVTIHGTNDTPTLSAAVATVVEDVQTLAQGTLIAHDADIHDVLSFLPKDHEPGVYGTLTLTADGAYTYALNNSLWAVQQLGAGETLSETFLCVVRDSHGVPATNTLTITIQGTNDAPIVTPFTASVTEDNLTTAQGRISVTDPDIHDSVHLVPQHNTHGQYGTLTLAADGAYTYTLNNSLGAVQGLTAGERLTETFTYTAVDSHGSASTSTLTVTIHGTNDAPITTPATAFVREDTLTHIIGTLPAPTDPDNTADNIQSDTLTFVPIANGVGIYGTFNLNTNGGYAYTLNNSMPEVQRLGVGQSLQEIFHYAVQDQHGGVSVNTLTVTIHGTNDAPVVSAATGSLTKDTNMLRDTLPAPSDIDAGDTASFVLQPHTVGRYGSLHLNTDGSFFYNLNNKMPVVSQLSPNATLTETFTYTVTDSSGATTQSTLTITILGQGSDSTPLLSASAQVTEDSQTVVTGTVPLPAGSGDDKHDGKHDDPPDSPGHTGSSTTPATPQINTQGQYGTLNLHADGTYTYTLNNSMGAVQGLTTGESLTDTFGYTAGSTTGTLVVTIHGTNDAPRVQTHTLHAVENTQIALSGTLGTIDDPDNTADNTHSDLATYVAQNNTVGAYGTLSLSASGSYVYVLHNASAAVQGLGQGESANDVFTYTTVDQHGGRTLNTLTITVHGTNEAPVIQAASAQVNDDAASVVSGALPAPTDPDLHDTHSYTPAVITTAYGQALVQADGTYTYVLNTTAQPVIALSQGETLQDTFTYTVNDNHGASASNTFHITIVGTNTAPFVESSSTDVTTHSELVAYGRIPTPHDVDAHDTVLFTPLDNVSGQYGTLTLSPTGVYTYVLDNARARTVSQDENATDTFTYTVQDGHGGTAQNTLTVHIHGVNEAPTVDATSTTLAEYSQPTITGLLPAPVDINLHDTHSYVPQTGHQGMYGALTIDPSGNYSYMLDNNNPLVQTLQPGQVLTETFSYTVADNHGATAHNTLTLTILGENPPLPETAPVLDTLLNSPHSVDSVDSLLPPTHQQETTKPTDHAQASAGQSEAHGSSATGSEASENEDLQSVILHEVTKNSL